MAALSIDSEHKERDWQSENGASECQPNGLGIAQNTILPLNSNMDRLRKFVIDSEEHLPGELPNESDSAVVTEKMEINDPWTAIREIWELPAGQCSHSYGYATSGWYTPPRSPLDPPNQGTSKNLKTDERFQQPRTPISRVFESPRYETYKGVQQPIRTTTTYPFTPDDSPLPLFTRRTPPNSNELQNSKARGFDQTSSHNLEPATNEKYPLVEDQTRQDSLLGDPLPVPTLMGEANSSSSRNNRKITTWPAPKQAPQPTGPFLASSRIRYRRPFSDSVLRVVNDINQDLIECCADLAMHKPTSLALADKALAKAQESGIYHLVSRSQLYRGLCLMELKRWKEASCAFTRAASVRDWQGKAWELKNMAEANYLQESRRKGRRRVERVEDESWDNHHR